MHGLSAAGAKAGVKKYTSDHPPLLCDLIFSNLSYVFNLSTRSNLTSVLRCYTYILDVLVFTVFTLISQISIVFFLIFSHQSNNQNTHLPRCQIKKNDRTDRQIWKVILHVEIHVTNALIIGRGNNLHVLTHAALNIAYKALIFMLVAIHSRTDRHTKV